MRTSDQGLRFLKDREGLRLHPYPDSRGIPTIGIGSTLYENGIHVQMSDPAITEDRAFALFRNTLVQYENGINVVIKVPLANNQFDACVSFTYNEGVHAFQGSTLCKLINAGDIAGASDEFLKWEKAGADAHILQGRREKERDLFLNGNY